MRTSSRELGKRGFSQSDQEHFAELSGDFNPVHIDPLAARRSIFGEVVVHGVHLLLWALDAWCAGRKTPVRLVTIKAEFPHHLGLNREVCCSVEDNADGKVRLEARCGAVRVLSAAISYDECPECRRHLLECGGLTPLSKALSSRRNPKRFAHMEELASMSGRIDLCLDPALAKRMLPDLAAMLSQEQIAVMLATTRLVGMECPGWNSVFGGLTLEFRENMADLGYLDYRVVKVAGSLSLVKIGLHGDGLEGSISAFLRPPPKVQLSCLELASEVKSGEFKEQNALVIGGSRGLGEVTAKLLAGGGADVRLTYHRGADDAVRVCDDIKTGGGRAECLELNVLDVPGDLVQRLGRGWLPSHVYYYATPFIFGATADEFSFDIFQHFCDFYVRGFLDIVRCLAGAGEGDLRILYPSSVAVDEMPRNMGEYASAKIAGEKMCASVQQKWKNVRIVVCRFPRLATDQTASMLKVDNKDPVPIVLEELRRMKEMK